MDMSLVFRNFTYTENFNCNNLLYGYCGAAAKSCGSIPTPAPSLAHRFPLVVYFPAAEHLP